VLVAVPAAAATAGVIVVVRALSTSPAHLTVCRVAGGPVPIALQLDQAANAATIATVGKAMGLPDHAVTVALATALQESRLRNLSHGDLDSLGLFQQRPSQGWGTPAQILTPSYAARTFYTHLVQVPDWQTRPLTEAAQQVQRSATPDAYAVWEPEARTMAGALTGEVAAGLTCSFTPQPGQAGGAALAQALGAEVGPPGLGVPVSPARGWTVASWLVAHAYWFKLTSVSFADRRWTARSGRWRPDRGAGAAVAVG
jgi:hypothetical protein